MQFQVNLAAGERQRQDSAGNSFVLLDTGAASEVEVWLMRNNEELEFIRTAKRGLRMLVAEGFTHFFMRAAGAAVCEVVASNGRVDVGFLDGLNVNATLIGLPVPVSNDRGTPGNLLFVSGVSIADAPAVTTPDNAAVACTAVLALILAADATRRQIIFTNIGTDDVTLGAAGHTWAKRCIVLKSGDSFVEDRASNLAWYGICDATKTASVTTKTVLA